MRAICNLLGHTAPRPELGFSYRNGICQRCGLWKAFSNEELDKLAEDRADLEAMKRVAAQGNTLQPWHEVKARLKSGDQSDV